MIEIIEAREKQTRQFFKLLNKLMLSMWRLGLGRFMQNNQSGYIMVLITTGHKSGLRRRAPINYARDDDIVYCLPGFGARTHWYRNLMADPKCEVWLPDGQWNGVADEISDADERLEILCRVLIRAGFATRLVEGLDPAKISEEKLHELGERYDKLLRIKLVSQVTEQTGPDKPGDLVWVWPVVAVVGLLLRELRRIGK